MNSPRFGTNPHAGTCESGGLGPNRIDWRAEGTVCRPTGPHGLTWSECADVSGEARGPRSPSPPTGSRGTPGNPEAKDTGRTRRPGLPSPAARASPDPGQRPASGRGARPRESRNALRRQLHEIAWRQPLPFVTGRDKERVRVLTIECLAVTEPVADAARLRAGERPAHTLTSSLHWRTSSASHDIRIAACPDGGSARETSARPGAEA
jgi:hypothetical protein